MSNIIVWNNRLVIFFLLIMLSCNSIVENKINDSLKADYIDVCELAKNVSSYDNKTVKVKGKLKGFHQLILYSDECPGEENIILLDIGYVAFSEYFKDVKRNIEQNNEITGKIFLVGKIEKNAGTMFNYGEFVYDTQNKEVIKEPKDITVSKIVAIEIDSFVPEY